MQAVCDARRRFLDIDIGHPGCTSDYLAFAMSSLHKKLEGKNKHNAEQPFLHPGLALYGDNAYVNTRYMVVPFKAVSSGPEDNYNFYHSQLRINIECAFGMLVHRWGILRKAMPTGITVAKTSVLVLALCKLHNFCIEERDEIILKLTPSDSVEIALQGGIDLETSTGTSIGNANDKSDDGLYQNMRRIDDLLDGGEHRDDFPQNWGRFLPIEAASFPFQSMLRYIAEQGFQRPAGGRKIR